MTNKSRHYDLLIDSLSQLDRLNLEDLEAIGEDIDDNELVCHNDWLAKGEDDGIYGCIIQRCASISLSVVAAEMNSSVDECPLWYQAIQAFDQEVLRYLNHEDLDNHMARDCFLFSRSHLIKGEIAKKLWKKCLAEVEETE